MGRWIGAILAGIYFVLQLQAQTPAVEAPKDQAAVGQTPAAAQEKTGYPLDAFKDFSAIMLGSIMEPGEGTVESHIYRSGNLMRMEGTEGHGYLITDLSTLETYGVSNGPCMRDTHPYFRSSPFGASRPGSNVVRTAVRKEVVDGHSCQVEDVTISPSKPGTMPLKLRFWEADDLQGFPIKIEYLRPGDHNSIVRYKNVVLGPQDQTLFIHPKSCASFSQSESKTSKTSPKSKKPAVAPKSNSPQ